MTTKTIRRKAVRVCYLLYNIRIRDEKVSIISASWVCFAIAVACLPIALLIIKSDRIQSQHLIVQIIKVKVEPDMRNDLGLLINRSKKIHGFEDILLQKLSNEKLGPSNQLKLIDFFSAMASDAAKVDDESYRASMLSKYDSLINHCIKNNINFDLLITSMSSFPPQQIIKIVNSASLKHQDNSKLLQMLFRTVRISCHRFGCDASSKVEISNMLEPYLIRCDSVGAEAVAALYHCGTIDKINIKNYLDRCKDHDKILDFQIEYLSHLVSVGVGVENSREKERKK